MMKMQAVEIVKVNVNVNVSETCDDEWFGDCGKDRRQSWRQYS